MRKAPLVLDEWVDRVFSRPLARAVVAVAARTPITPNGLTAISGSCGVCAGVSIALGHGVAAGVFLLLFLVFDCSDGQLARRRGGGGVFGRAVDGVGDYVTAIAVHVGLWVGLARDGRAWWHAGLLAAGAGFALWWASFLLDRYKRRYGQKRDDLDEVRRELAASTGFRRFAVRNFLTYAEQLERDDVHIPDLEAYRVRTRAPMLAFLCLGPTTHYAAMAVCLIAGWVSGYCWAAIAGIAVTAATLAWQHHAASEVVAKPQAETTAARPGTDATPADEAVVKEHREEVG